VARGAAKALHCDGEAVTLGPCLEGQFLKRAGNKLIGAEAGGDSGAIEDHEAAADPHPGYLTSVEADAIYEAVGASASAVASHEAASDPHPAYLKQAEADALYDPAGEAVAEVAAHEALANPHPVYTTAAEASAAAPVQSVAGKTGVVTLAKADVGLGSVDNTSDAAKPVSTATQTALDAKQATSAKGQANGYASLGADGKVPSAQLPAAGGGSDPWTIVALDNDFTMSSTTAADVGLAFTPAANGRYMFEAVLGIRTATATVNPRVGLAWATGLTDGVAQIDESQSATARLMANGNIAAPLLIAVGGVPNTNQTWPVTVWGWVKAGATPSGTVRIQLATETAGTVVRVTAHSYLRFRSY
jgi:hypothetical protein